MQVYVSLVCACSSRSGDRVITLRSSMMHLDELHDATLLMICTNTCIIQILMAQELSQGTVVLAKVPGAIAFWPAKVALADKERQGFVYVRLFGSKDR
jgi:hypothetical protein